MATPAVLSVRIIGDAVKGVKAFEQTESAAGKMQRGVERASVAAGVALAGLAAAAKKVGDAASEAEQAAGAVDSVFGGYATSVKGYAAEAADAVGLAADQYNNLSSVLGSQLKNMGVPMQDLVGQTDQLIGLGADLAATFGGTTADAVAALSSLLRGERDPIERYGVSIKQADINAQKAAMGLDGLTGEAAKAADTQATLALLTQQTADAQGQFGREANTAAGMQERANAQWRNAQIELGEALLPVMTQASTILAELARWIGDNATIVQILAVGLGALAGAVLIINGAMKAYAAIQAIQTVAQWAQNAAWLASPITWIVLAIVAAIALVVAIIVLWINNWDELCAAVETGAREIGNFFHDIGQWAANTFGGIIRWIQDVIGWFAQLFGAQDRANSNTANAAARTASMSAQTLEGPAQIQARAMLAAPATRDTFAPLARRVLTPQVGVSRAADDRPTNVYNITVNGAVDPNGVARQIRNLLRDDARATGARAAGGTRTAWA